MPEGTFFQELKQPATAATAKVFKEVLVTEAEDWWQLIINQIQGTHHVEDEPSSIRMAARARSYTIVDETLYNKGVVQPLLKCITQIEGKELLKEIHSRMCGSYIGP